MKKEKEIIICKKNNNIFSFHKKTPSNYNISTDINDIKKVYKKISSNTNQSSISNRNKSKNVVNNSKISNINSPKSNDLNINYTETKKIIKIKKTLKNYDLQLEEKYANDSKKLNYENEMISNSNLKSYRNSIINSKSKLIKNKNNKYNIIRINNKENCINLKKPKNYICTNYLFKKNKTHLIEKTNKSFKKKKKLLINSFTKNTTRNSIKEVNKNKSNNNILNLNKKLINKMCNFNNHKKDKIMNNSIQLDYIFNTYKSKSLIKRNDIISNNKGQTLNYSNTIRRKINKNIFKNFTNIKNSVKVLNNNNYISINNINNINNFNIITNSKKKIKTIESNNSKRKYKKKLKKTLSIKQNNLKNSEIKLFKKEKEFEPNKNICPLKRQKRYIYNIDSKIIKSLELDKMDHSNVDISYLFNRKRRSYIREELENYIDISRYKFSPINNINLKSNNISNDIKKKKNIYSSCKINDYKFIKKNNTYFKNRIKKTKKNLSIQLNDNNDKNNNNEKNKTINNNTIKRNNIDNNKTVKNIYDFSNNNYKISRNCKILNSYHNSNYLKKTESKFQKIKACKIDFDKVSLKTKKQLYNRNTVKENINYNNKINFLQINNRNKLKINKERKYHDEESISLSNLFFKENIDLDFSQDSNNSINNPVKNNIKNNYHFMNTIELNSNSKIKVFPNISISLLSLLKEKKICNEIINFCCSKSLNKLSLINKQYYKYIKPYIYEKIKLKIKKIHRECKNFNNNIKKSMLQYSHLSTLSSTILKKKYIDLLNEINEKSDIEIKKDILRTSPNNNSFQYGNENYNKLYHILLAYSNYNKNIGYAQGLNFLALKCVIIYKNEIKAFIFLDALIRKFNLENLLGIKNNKLNQKIGEIEYTLNKWCPEVNQHLQKIFLNYDFFVCKWMMTLFSNDMNIKYLFHLWDYMIIFGWKFFKGFVIAVIKCNEGIILKSTLDTITSIMNDILKTKEFENNFNNIINYAFKYINEENEIL